MRQNIIKDIILVGLLAGAFAPVSQAQGLPSYYELVEPGEELVTGKNYLICDILSDWQQTPLLPNDVVFAN